MSRSIKTFQRSIAALSMKPSECEIAPDRYSVEPFDTDYRDPHTTSFREFRAKCPYQPGDVILCERYMRGENVACRAVVLAIFNEFDRYGDRLEKYRVSFATAKDGWSGLYNDVWPGYVQRGYKRADQAPAK